MYTNLFGSDTMNKVTKKAEMGMGTLIIFIAMILVAAVAASVLITTTSSLQNKALDTGRSTTREVGTSLQMLELYAEDGSDQALNEIYGSMKLSAGSDPIRFIDVLVSLRLSNETQDYAYNSTTDCTNTTAVAALDASHGFGISYSINGTDNTAGYLTRGDVVKFCIKAPQDILEDEELRLSFIPKVGSPLAVTTTTPSLMLSVREELFP